MFSCFIDRYWRWKFSKHFHMHAGNSQPSKLQKDLFVYGKFRFYEREVRSVQEENPIGVIDSGVGGLTVVKELQRLLPRENLVYYGDSVNCPYGNRSQDEIVSLTCRMLKFLQKENVKLVAVACNTISTIIDQFQADFPFPIIGIVQPASQKIAKENLDVVGIIATAFTIKTGVYQNLIHQYNPSMKVCGEGSPNLAALIDQGKYEGKEITDEVSLHVQKLLEQDRNIKHIILGCTHYPIVTNTFQEVSPSGMTFINPAVEQAQAVHDYLKSKDLLNVSDKGSLRIFTSGVASPYDALVKRLGIKTAYPITAQENSD
jgi:glutamate racemase